MTARLGAAYVRGMQTPGGEGTPLHVRSIAKHFAVYNLESNFAVGGSDGQYRLGYNAEPSQADLLQTFLPAFEHLVRNASVRGVMCSYNAVAGTPMCASDLLQAELRDRIGFDGVVITDSGAIKFMVVDHRWKHSDGKPYTPMEAVAASVAAGTDLNLGGCFGRENAGLASAFSQKLINTSMVKQAAGRQLLSLLELGLMQDTTAAAADTRRQHPMSIVDSAPHRQLAKAAAVKGVVLLKNSKGALPLEKVADTPLVHKAADLRPRASAKKKVLAVIGPNADRNLTLGSNYCGCKNRAGGPLLSSCKFVTPLEGLSSAVHNFSDWDDNVLHEPGVDIDTQRTDGIAAAVAAARNADVVVVVAGLITCQEVGSQCQEAEGRDRSTPLGRNGKNGGRDVGIQLPGMQLELLKALANSTNAARTNIILVIMSGSAVALPWAAKEDRIGAIVQLFYPGVLGGAALADVVFGFSAPAGRLPVTVPSSESQLPEDYLNQSMLAGDGRTHRYFRGTPLYPFGFGMGYSTFGYSNLRLSQQTLLAGETADIDAKITVAVTVTNRGEFSGSSEEVVMVFATPKLRYLATQNMSVPRQIMLGFSRIATTPNHAVEAAVVIYARDLRLVGQGGEFGLLSGDYTVSVGGRAPHEHGGGEREREGGEEAAAFGGVDPPLTAVLRIKSDDDAAVGTRLQ